MFYIYSSVNYSIFLLNIRTTRFCLIYIISLIIIFLVPNYFFFYSANLNAYSYLANFSAYNLYFYYFYCNFLLCA